MRMISRRNMTTLLQKGNEVETSFAKARGFDPAAASWPELFRATLGVAGPEGYFKWLRRRSNRPSVIRLAGQMEKMLRSPSSFFLRNPDREAYERDDYLIKRGQLDTEAVADLSAFLHAQGTYYDIYQGDYQQEGLHAPDGPATVYVRTVDFVRSDPFWRIITTPVVYETCRNILGKNARITWAWLWYSDPRDDAYENQNWHRDSAEPFNIVRLFVPLTTVADVDDGPTVIVKGSSTKGKLFARRRFSDQEVVDAFGEDDIVMALADLGDIYFANTFCVHRGIPPQRPREMLSLLVSYQNSYRTKGLPLVPLSSLTSEQQDFVSRHRNFFSELCDPDQ